MILVAITLMGCGSGGKKCECPDESQWERDNQEVVAELLEEIPPPPKKVKKKKVKKDERQKKVSGTKRVRH